MNINIKQIQHFIVVAKELHYRRAAQVANVPQPALSRSIQALETELGVQLLARNNRRVTLTAAGQEFLDGAHQLIASMSTTVNSTKRVGRRESGGLRIGYSYIAMCGFLPGLIRAFEREHPDIPLETLSGQSAQLLESLCHDELDFNFMTKPFGYHELQTTTIQSDRFLVALNSKHPLAAQQEMSVSELSEQKILLCSAPYGCFMNQYIARLFQKVGLVPNIEWIQQDQLGVYGLIALGRGVGVVTEGHGDVYRKDTKIIELTGVDDTLPTVMAWREDQHNDSKSRFLSFAQNYINENYQPEPRSTIPVSSVVGDEVFA